MIKELFSIIKGWWNLLFHKPSKLAKIRINICQTCKYNNKGWCDLCGCFLKAKVRVDNEICHANKWPNVNDNEYIK